MPRDKLSGPAFAALNPQQRKFVELYVDTGMSASQARRAAGYTKTSGGSRVYELTRGAKVAAAIMERRQRHEQLFDVDRRKVVDGMMEAINMAKLMSEPMVMVAGWREVGRLCGYYEAQKHKVDITVTGDVTVRQLQQMSDTDLLKLADGVVHEGSFTEVEVDPETLDDTEAGES